jgi:4-diphosphocytidyl-2-C-methyl-D-erythritol kinase
MISFPNAKINLGLYVTEKRPDGFHNIESCFYPVGWKDILEIIPAKIFSFTSSGIDIPGDAKSNLCVKAYQFLQHDYQIPPVQIHLHKVIPIGAGLGGGSADGAFTIKMLNTIFKLDLSIAQMENYARKLGSDCAFFIRNKPVFCFGKGDQFEDVEVNLSNYFFALINPQIHVGTTEAYAGISPQFPFQSIKGVLQKPVHEWRNQLSNDFEKTVCKKYQAITDIKEILYTQGAFYASMSGSGSTVYGIFSDEKNLISLFPKEYMIWQGKAWAET